MIELDRAELTIGPTLGALGFASGIRRSPVAGALGLPRTRSRRPSHRGDRYRLRRMRVRLRAGTSFDMTRAGASVCSPTPDRCPRPVRWLAAAATIRGARWRFRRRLPRATPAPVTAIQAVTGGSRCWWGDRSYINLLSRTAEQPAAGKLPALEAAAPPTHLSQCAARSLRRFPSERCPRPLPAPAPTA